MVLLASLANVALLPHALFGWTEQPRSWENLQLPTASRTPQILIPSPPPPTPTSHTGCSQEYQLSINKNNNRCELVSPLPAPVSPWENYYHALGKRITINLKILINLFETSYNWVYNFFLIIHRIVPCFKYLLIWLPLVLSPETYLELLLVRCYGASYMTNALINWDILSPNAYFMHV